MRKQSAYIRSYRGAWPKASREFLKANPQCAGWKCQNPATHVDHITPHKGNPKLMWDKGNWQSLCWTCHNIKTQAERAGKSAFDDKGRPIDANHFWNSGKKTYGPG